jgi:hypothetical protein
MKALGGRTTSLPSLGASQVLSPAEDAVQLQQALEKVLAREKLCVQELAYLLVHAQGKEYNALLARIPATQYKLRRKVASTVCRARAAYAAHVDEYYRYADRIQTAAQGRQVDRLRGAVEAWPYASEPLLATAERTLAKLSSELRHQQGMVKEALDLRKEEYVRNAVASWKFPPRARLDLADAPFALFLEAKALLEAYDAKYAAIEAAYAAGDPSKPLTKSSDAELAALVRATGLDPAAMAPGTDPPRPFSTMSREEKIETISGRRDLALRELRRHLTDLDGIPVIPLKEKEAFLMKAVRAAGPKP